MNTRIILNFTFAWLTVFVSIVLLSKYFLRKLVEKTHGNNNILKTQINNTWRNVHIVLGFVLIIIGLLHGINSPFKVLSVNTGTITWLVTICFGFSWLLKKRLKTKWMQLHRILSVLFVLLIIWHVISVGGIKVYWMLPRILHK